MCWEAIHNEFSHEHQAGCMQGLDGASVRDEVHKYEGIKETAAPGMVVVDPVSALRGQHACEVSQQLGGGVTAQSRSSIVRLHATAEAAGPEVEAIEQICCRKAIFKQY